MDDPLDELKDIRPALGSPLGMAWLYEIDLDHVREQQTQTRGRGIFSSPFAAIIHGGGYRVRGADKPP